MFPAKINLSNRYKDKNYLELIDTDDNYKGKTVGVYRVIKEFDFPFRGGFDDNGNQFFDMSGGPFLAEGDTLLGSLKIVDMDILGIHDVFIYLEYADNLL